MLDNQQPQIIDAPELAPAKETMHTQDILSDGVHVRATFIPTHRKISTKKLPNERISVLAMGSVVVDDEGLKIRYSAPAYIRLEADKQYDLITLEDSVLYGINPTPAKDIDQIVNIDLQPEHFFAGGVYAKKMIIKKDTQVPTHKHIFDHLSLLAQGRVRVTVGKIITEYVAPVVIEIKKDMVHTVVALEDSVWFCIHATDVIDPETIDMTLVAGE